MQLHPSVWWEPPSCSVRLDYTLDNTLGWRQKGKVVTSLWQRQEGVQEGTKTSHGAGKGAELVRSEALGGNWGRTRQGRSCVLGKGCEQTGMAAAGGTSCSSPVFCSFLRRASTQRLCHGTRSKPGPGSPGPHPGGRG